MLRDSPRRRVAAAWRLPAAGAAVTSVVIVGSGSNYFGYDDDSERRSIASLENKSEAVVKFKNSPVPTRDQQMTRLTAGKEYDVLVIGGGATGSGVALDAQMRGLDTALIERGDFANETSRPLHQADLGRYPATSPLPSRNC